MTLINYMNMSHRHLEENSAGSPRGDGPSDASAYEARIEWCLGVIGLGHGHVVRALQHASSFLRPSPLFEHREEGPVGRSDH